MIDIVTPTASGKSTRFPLALAKQMLKNKRTGIILVLNPLKAVPISLVSYMKGLLRQEGLEKQIECHHAVGGVTSFSTWDGLYAEASRIPTVLFMSYGLFWSKQRIEQLRVVLLDEVHTRHPSVRAVELMYRHIETHHHYPVVTMNGQEQIISCPVMVRLIAPFAIERFTHQKNKPKLLTLFGST